MDKTERWEYHRYIDACSDRQLAKERIEMEYALETLPAESEHRPEFRWMLRVVMEEITARHQVNEYLRKRLQRR